MEFGVLLYSSVQSFFYLCIHGHNHCIHYHNLQVGVQTSQMEMLPSGSQMFSWETFNEDLTALDDSAKFSAPGLLEQINVTRDTSDYLWYITE